MKMKQNYLNIVGAAMMAALMGACSSVDTVPADNADNEMRFEVSHPEGSVSRVGSSAFEKGDVIGVSVVESGATLDIGGNNVNNAAVSYDGTDWKSASQIKWNDGKYDVYAWYPRTDKLTSATDQPFAVSLDQSTKAGYEASDFLWSSSKGVAGGDGAVKLAFAHKMSRMYIKLVKGAQYDGELPDDAEVYIHNTVPEATIDLAAGVVTRDQYADAATIKAKQLGVGEYAAIIVPQRLDNRRPLVEVIAKGVSYLYEARFVFKPGIQHTVALTISNNPDRIKIEIGGELSNWN